MIQHKRLGVSKTRSLLLLFSGLALAPAACSDDGPADPARLDAASDVAAHLDSANPGGDALPGLDVHDAPVADAGAAGDSAGPLDVGEDVASNDAASEDAADGPPAATWTQIYSTVITAHCTPCHTTPTGIGVTSGKLDMTSQATAYQNLISIPAAGAACNGMGTRIVPGAPDSSILYLKVSLDDPTPCGGKMPLGGPALDQAQADMIESWISAGAQNN